jgi:hypothetical protein
MPTATLEPPTAPTAPEITPPAAPVVSAPAAPAPDNKTLDQAFDDRFKDLDSTPPSAPTATEKPKAEAPPAKPAEAAPKADAPPKPAAEPEADEQYVAPAEGTMSKVRSWGTRMAAMAKKATGEARQLREKLEEAQRNPPTPKDSKDIAALTSKLESTEKRLAEYEGTLQLTRYERSQDYRDKYESPWRQHQVEAETDVEQMIVNEPNEDDPDNPKEREATKTDFEEIYALSLGPASRLAYKKFGPEQAPTVMQHYRQLHTDARAAYNAIAEHKTKGAEFEKQTTAQRLQEQQQRDTLWQQINEKILAKYPQYFDEHQGDPEWNESLAKGRSIADLKYTDAWNKLTPQQQVALDAQVYHRTAAFPALLKQVSALETKLAEANKIIEGLRGSGPGKPSATGETPSAPPADTMDAFERAKF